MDGMKGNVDRWNKYTNNYAEIISIRKFLK